MTAKPQGARWADHPEKNAQRLTFPMLWRLQKFHDQSACCLAKFFVIIRTNKPSEQENIQGVEEGAGYMSRLGVGNAVSRCRITNECVSKASEDDSRVGRKIEYAIAGDSFWY